MNPTYGAEWAEFRRWYFSRRTTRKRCFWCHSRSRKGNPIQLNHLDYREPADWPGRWRVKPMCRRCHRIETGLTRMLFHEYPRRRNRYAHWYVTYGVRLAIRGAVLLVLVSPLLWR